MYRFSIQTRNIWLTSLLLISISYPNQDCLSQPALFDNFLGTWHGAGTLFGKEAKFSMTWERSPYGQFVHLSFRNPAITAEAFYHLDNAQSYRGTWVDSRGVSLPLAAVVKDSVLETTWGSPETEQGRTSYHLRAADSIEVTDFVLKDGKWTRFGRARYTRSKTLLPEKMRWLLGSWRRETERSVTHETWRRLSDHTFEGESVRISKAGGDTTFTESLLLAEMQGELFYLPKVAENPIPVAFKAVAFEDDQIVFENVEHDFPQRITYKQPAADSMTCIIAGPVDGKDRQVSFDFTRRNASVR